MTGITAHKERLKEFVSGFDAIGPITFYYDNSPYSELITEKVKSYYFKDDENSIKDGILKVCSFSKIACNFF